MLARTLVVSLTAALALLACGGEDQSGLFGGSGAGAGGAGVGGASGGDGGSGLEPGSGGTTTGGGSNAGGSGGAGLGGAVSGGMGGVGGANTGGMGGVGGMGGGNTGGMGGGNTGGMGGGNTGGMGGGNAGGMGGGNAGGMGGSGAATGTGIACGPATCTDGNSFCCQQWTGSKYEPSCQPDWQSCYGTDVHCDGPEDCDADEVCCGTLVSSQGGSYYTDFSCKNSCNYPGARVICGQKPGVCPSGTTCKTSTILPQYKVCGS